MDIQQAKQKFIDSWGSMASEWGVPKAMAQIHALLLISPEPLCSDEIREGLDLSTGSVSTNLRDLEHWGLVHRHTQPGRSKDLYTAEKDMWTVVMQIIKNRKQRELEPMLQVLEELTEVEPRCPASQRFCEAVQDIRKFSHKANELLDSVVKSERSWLLRSLMR